MRLIHAARAADETTAVRDPGPESRSGIPIRIPDPDSRSGFPTRDPRDGRGAPAGAPAAVSDVEAVVHHDLGPGRDEVFDELRVAVSSGIDLRERAQFGMRAEDQVDGGCRPA